MSRITNFLQNISPVTDRVTEAFTKVEEKANSLKSRFEGLQERASNAANTAPRRTLAKISAKTAHAMEAAKDGLCNSMAEMKANVYKYEGNTQTQGPLLDRAADLVGKTIEAGKTVRRAASSLAGSVQARTVRSAPAPQAERRSMLKTLHMKERLSPERVEAQMKTQEGRDSLRVDVSAFLVDVGMQTQVRLKDSWRDSTDRKIHSAAESLITNAHDILARLDTLDGADMPERHRQRSLNRLGLESPISLSYVEANAGTASGIARMKQELDQFDQSLHRAYKKGHLRLHPDKVAQRNGGTVEAASAEFDKFKVAHTTLKKLSEGLRSHLAQAEARLQGSA